MNILILEDDTNGARALQTELLKKPGVMRVDHAQSVEEANQYKSIANYDVCLVDIIMPSRDGFSFLEDICQRNEKSIVVSSASNRTLIDKAFSMGVSYFMIKPYCADIVYNRIVDVLNANTQGAVYASPYTEDNMPKIRKLLLMLGVPTHLSGYRYLCTAVDEITHNRSLMQNITKKLYPAVAQRHQSTPQKVELSIRHAIELLYQRDRLKMLNEIFGYAVYSGEGKPTNGELIALLAEWLTEN